MTDRKSQEDRTRHLISELVDGQPSREDVDELNELVQSDTSRASLVVDHLLLDSLPEAWARIGGIAPGT